MLESNVFAFEGLVNSTEIEVLFEDGFKDVFPTRLFKEVESVDKEFFISAIAEIEVLFSEIFVSIISFCGVFSASTRESTI